MLALIYQGLQANPANLRLVGILLGSVLLLGHGTALARPARSLELARRFPRHRLSGIVLLSIATAWSWCLLVGVQLGPLHIPRMILGEFSWVRRPLILAMPVLLVLVLLYADELLPIRALGCLQFLVASLLLDIAWMHFVHPTRQLLPLYCYGVLILPGILMIAQPWRFRDLLDRFESRPKAWQAALAAGAAFGLLLLVCAALWWR